jgi:hypothetical protein
MLRFYQRCGLTAELFVISLALMDHNAQAPYLFTDHDSL